MTFPSLRSLLFLITFSYFTIPHAHAVEWWTRSARLTGTSEATRRSELRALRETPEIETTLRAALEGPRKALALDTIVALPLPSLIPDLLKAAEQDRSGAVDLALGAMLTPDSAPSIIASAEKRLAKRQSLPAPAVQIVLLDLLGRLDRPIPAPKIEIFLQSPSYEVRSAALLYVRTRLMNLHDRAYLPVLGKALTLAPYQLRLQAVHVVRDLPDSLIAEGRMRLTVCCQDKNAEVRAACIAPTEETE